MSVFRLVVIVFLMVVLVACGTNGRTSWTKNEPTTPMHDTAANGEPEAIALLLEQGADMEARDDYGWTSLHFAAARNKPEAVALLLDRGADIEARDDYEWTPLHVAAMGNNPEVVALLLDRGADIEARDDIPSQISWEAVLAKTLLGVLSLSLVAINPDTAADRGREFGKVLYKPVSLDISENTPLHLAAWRNNPEVVALLLDRGADVEARNEIGSTPLHFAAVRNKPEAIALLLDGGADIDARDEYGGVPLHFATRNNKPEVVALLLDRGADAEVRDDYDSTPLDYAEKNEHLKGTSVLERLKASQE